MERFNVPSKINRDVANAIKIRVAIFLKNWIESPYEQLDPIMEEKVSQFIDGLIAQDIPNLVPMLKKAMDSHSKKFIYPALYSGEIPKPKLSRNLSEQLSFLDVHPLEMARQLTIRFFDIYKKIKHTEFFGQSWIKSSSSSENILKMINFFNEVSLWVSTTVLLATKIRDRVKIMETFIKIAAASRELNNFHLLMAILSAFFSSPLLRLKWTKEKLSKRTKQILKSLEELMSMEKAFKNYRSALKNAEAPCIPYIGVYLTDLVFIEDGNPNLVGKRMNFVKQKYIYNIVSTVQRYQKFPYNLAIVQPIQNLYDSSPKNGNQELFDLSLLREPRGATRNEIL